VSQYTGSPSDEILLLSRSDVRSVLDMGELIAAVEAAHADVARGRAAQLPRYSLHVPGSTVGVFPMVAVLEGGAGGMKVFTDVPENAARGLPTQQSVVVLLDVDRGHPVAVLDGGLLTAYRTAAASAVATRHLARSDSTCLGLLGVGAQARTHLNAIGRVLELERVVVWGRNRGRAEAFARDAAAVGVAVDVVDSPERVAACADVLCTLTPSRTPILAGAWLREGVHVNVVGAPPRLDHREVDAEAVRRARVVVDSFDSVKAESGDLMIAVEEGAVTTDHFRDELGEVIVGAKPGRARRDEITMYKSVGVAVQDVAAARLAYVRAVAAGAGTRFALRA